MQRFALALALLALTACVAAHNHKGNLAEQAALLANPPVWPALNGGAGGAEKMSCGTCNVLVDVIYAAQATNASREETIALLDDACAKEFPKSPALCDDIVKVAVDELPKIVKAIWQLGYNTSQEVCSCLEFCTIQCCATPQSPEQVHINWFGALTQMRVSWTTLNSTAASTVQYGVSASALNMTNAVNEPEWTYTRGGWLGTLHTALMTGLLPDTQYWYRVGSAAEDMWSDVLTFTTLPAEPDSITFATIGDMGSDWHSDETVQNLIAALEAGKYQAVIHNGDISYADGNEKNWDIFLRKLQPVASRVPYMTTAGNHELWWNFTAYKARFGAVMPYSESIVPSDNSMYYSFDLGSNFHFVGFNTETAIDTADVTPEQVAWLKADLSSAAAQNARWRVAYAHRPVYCANTDKEQCTDFPAILQAQVESVFRDHDVALVLTAHEHNYQRTWPVFQKQVLNMSYENPSAPTYVVNGAGGNREGETMGFLKPLPEWMAFTETDTGFGLLTVAMPAVTYQFVDNKGPAVVDSFAITKP